MEPVTVQSSYWDWTADTFTQHAMSTWFWPAFLLLDCYWLQKLISAVGFPIRDATMVCHLLQRCEDIPTTRIRSPQASQLLIISDPDVHFPFSPCTWKHSLKDLDARALRSHNDAWAISRLSWRDLQMMCCAPA